jgi:cytoplasmic iron level regulating protein YaaA (DUF328/UPF0246 family)
MKTLIVTASSKSKRDFSDYKFNYSDKTSTGSIDAGIKKQVLDARNELIKDLEIEKGPDIQAKKISKDDGTYLPAYLRYSGRTYSKINLDAWKVITDNPEKFDCIILSALYGMIRCDEPIRNYEIKQVDKIPQKSSIKAFWKQNGAADWLFNYIKRNDFDAVKFVLSTSYAGIVSRDKLMLRLDEELGIPSEDNQFKEQGRKSMLLRGQYINDLLVNKL